MKTLVIAVHPALHESRIHRRWLEELRRYPEEITISSLYEKYPDGVIDIAREQRLAENHDRIVLQFPLYWFSSPPLLKQWLDEVLLEDWAYGKGIDLFASKTIGAAVSGGSQEDDYRREGRYRLDIHTLLSPLATTARYLEAGWEAPFVLYGAGSRMSDDEIARSAEAYARHLLSYKINRSFASPN
ncbi:NAD(P)H-dependent oxidoreductase [Saccharibacillus sp. CPCC 101409]|uniref:NAD(P)H-dependent oxidoreductase n=1 Tax=Saccharibacillus sp. CPCC 101409 TaxID=3058041 RepID=UPI002673A758|nr:NAD(P)H-dependent oxidoreductase [Saccharibacillus sp. CPCC 101409]MDO3408234.1 NAD(P)H-dependent oxidoreductase [Saccharibacillus sp. CPCC 101409]